MKKPTTTVLPTAGIVAGLAGGAVREECTMKYLILTYGTQRDYDLMAGSGSALTPEDFAPMHAFMQEFTTELAASGELVDTKGLAAPVHTRRVQLQAGVPVVTEGPPTTRWCCCSSAATRR